MKRFKKRKLKKKTGKIIMCGILVFFLCFLEFRFYSNKINDKLLSVAKVRVNEFLESFLSNNIGHNILNSDILEGIVIINQNENGDILYVDYDLDKAYIILDIVTEKLNTLINNLENGVYEVDSKNINRGESGIYVDVPMGLATGSVILANLGPKIYIPISFANSIITNIKTNIKNYGLNNAQMEMYITIRITTNLLTPIDTDSEVLEYDILISSTVINGRVPSVYGGLISSNSSLYSPS